MYNKRDSDSLKEILLDKKINKWIFIFRFFLNWFFERIASIAPLPTWRVFFHRLRGIKIGKNVYIGYDVIFDRIYPEKILIEDNAEIGDRCIISAHSRGSMVFRELYPRVIKPVYVRKGAWIMPGVIITPGVEIGEMAVVATGAVVTKDVIAKTLVAGVPAKKIKSLSTIRK